MLTVTLARESDEDELFDLLINRQVPESNRGLDFQISPDRIRQHVELGTRGRGGLHGIIRQDGMIVGAIGSMIDRWWWSDACMISALWLFVRPEYRGRGYDGALTAWLRARCDELGPNVLLVNCVISAERLPGKLRLWRRRGRMVGGIFLC